MSRTTHRFLSRIIRQGTFFARFSCCQRRPHDRCHGQRCFLGFPGICSGDPAKVVPCHLRIGNVAGTGRKPPDLCCLPGCFECHNVLDGRTPSGYSRMEIRAMTLEGYVQWMAHLWKNEIVIAVLSEREARMIARAV